MIADDSGNPDCAAADGDHYQDYSCPIDDEDSTPIYPDRSETGGAHVDDCLADYMHTSRSSDILYYGYSFWSRIPSSFIEYVEQASAGYAATASNVLFQNFSWNDYVDEISAGRPVVLIVDSDGDGITDHFATGVGYDASTNQYGVYTTWYPDIRWYDWAGVSQGTDWGIYGATLFDVNLTGVQISFQLSLITYGNPSIYRMFAHITQNEVPVPSGWDVTLTTSKGGFESAGGPQTWNTDTNADGEVYADIYTSDWGEVTLCCDLTNPDYPEDCTVGQFYEYPAPPIEPFDTLSLNVSSGGHNYDRSGGLDWSPDGSRIAGSGGMNLWVSAISTFGT